MIQSKLIITRFIVISIVFFGIVVLSPAPANELNSYRIRYNTECVKGSLSFDKLKGYDIVGLPDGDWLAEVGKPMLPSKHLKIALPAGMSVKSVQVVNTSQERILGEYNIFPAQPPLKIGLSDKDVGFVPPDNQTYISSQPYPSKLIEFVNQTDLAGQSMAVIQFYPLHYVPADRKLTLYSSITIEIVGVGGYECGDFLSPNISEKSRVTYEQMVKDMVVNPEEVELRTALKAGDLTVLPSGHFDHVIITHPSYATSFQPLSDWHTQKGIKDTIVTTTWIYDNYAGVDTQQIRAFVMDAKNTWGAIYFLIGGENETVPFCYRTYYNGEITPSDQYYSDLNDDWTHELFVGRASVGNTAQVTNFVNKVLQYEKNPPRTNYPLDVLLIGMDLDASTHSEELKENIDTYIPAHFNVTKVYDSQTTNHRTEVINALNAGQNLVNHADHCNQTEMGTGVVNHGWYISNADVDNLTNDNQFSIVVSTGCMPNYMDYNDCIAEHFVLSNPYQAGVAFTGNTRDGWYYSGNPFTLSHALEKQWWVGLFSRDKYKLGETLVDSKHNFSNTQLIEKHCEWTFNLLGEPEMPIWTDEPDSFTVTNPDTITTGTSSFTVHVEDATTHTAVNQAYVCLWKVNEVYLTGSTNTSGNVTLSPSPSTVGTIYVTVTMHNYIPFQKQVVVVQPYLRGDANGDGIINVGDIVYLVSYLYRGGPAPVPLPAGDANCDDIINVGDIVYLVSYLYRGGPPPSC